MGKPKSDGRLPEISRHDSPASSLRITSQCFCMYSTSAATGAWRGGARSDRPRRPGRDALGLQPLVHRAPGWPASSERNTPAAEIAANIRPCARGPAGSCAGTSRPRPAARTGRTHGRAASAAPPALAAVIGAEQPGVLDPGVDHVRVVQRRLQVPDPRELPRVRRPVVPLVGPGGALVIELVADRLPSRTAVVGSLDQPARTSRWTATRTADRGRPRALDVVDLPAGEVRPADLPRARRPSEVRMNAPLRVPTSTRTPLITSPPTLETTGSSHCDGQRAEDSSALPRPRAWSRSPSQGASRED